MTPEQKYKNYVKWSQSLTSGTIAFEGAIFFDDNEEPKDVANKLAHMLITTEHEFMTRGYTVASTIAAKQEEARNKAANMGVEKPKNAKH